MDQMTPQPKEQHGYLFLTITLAVLLLTSLVGNGFLASKLSSEPDKDQDTIERSKITLADAIELLPQPELAVAGREMSDGTYWIWVHDTREAKDLLPPAEYTWIVDVVAGTAEEISERYYGPAGGYPTIDAFTKDYLVVEWSGGWEGSYVVDTDYFNGETGERDYTLSVYSGQEVNIETKNQNLSVEFAPTGLCDHVTLEQDTDVVSATGLIINDVEYPSPVPFDVSCWFNAFGDQPTHNSFEYINLSSDVIRIGWESGTATIPVPGLNLDEIEYLIY